MEVKLTITTQHRHLANYKRAMHPRPNKTNILSK